MKTNKDFVFGIHSVLETLESGKQFDKVMIQKGLKGEQANQILELLRESQIPYQVVPKEKLNRITRKNHQGVIGFTAFVEYHSLEDVVPQLYEEGKDPFMLMLDGITDVRNFGAIARTAECLGVDAIIMAEKGSARINADAMKTSAGALNYIKIIRVKDLYRSINFLKTSGFKIAAATEKSEDTIFQADLSGPLTIIMGSEEDGVSNQLLKITDTPVKIPMSGNIESLNVSVAAGIFMAETVRQRSIQ